MLMLVELDAESDIFTGPNYREIFVQHEQFFRRMRENNGVLGSVYGTDGSTRPTAAEHKIKRR